MVNQTALAKWRELALFGSPQRVFEITPLVPGSPSLDARPHSPGGTRPRNCRFKIADSRLTGAIPKPDFSSQIANRQSTVQSKNRPHRNGLFEIPKTLEKKASTATDPYAKFTAEPFEAGYGHPVGNSLRRVLLSSLEGAAITEVKIAGAQP